MTLLGGVTGNKKNIPLLQAGKKRLKINPNFREGDLVVVIDHNLPRSQWPLRRVSSVHRSDDGFLRSANIRVDKYKESDVICLQKILGNKGNLVNFE